ncbi:hypothetical protein BS297_18735 [Rhodococcus erythropolis]|uniref:Uncharacterized protein n=1 Tax=Rhodococcus erythropolis TaxID=1833 RepID=A0A5N5E3M6_RHOER|nr:hypothetical protein BS297_18735 [Rhodococcus erythropolis]
MRSKIVVAAALSLSFFTAGCGGSDSTDSEQSQDSVVQSTSPTTEASPIRKKAIGEEAAAGCVEGAGRETCDVRFTITSITRGESCSGYSNGILALPANHEVVRFDIEVETAPEFSYAQANGVLLTQYWSVVDADGYMVKDPDIATGCDVDANVVYKFLEPGTKQRSSVPIIAPVGATTLRLSEQGHGWEWEIPVVAAAPPAASATPPVESPVAPTFQEWTPTTTTVAQNPVDSRPNPYPNSQDSFGRDTGTSGATLVGCGDWKEYQPGTGIYSDGSLDYAAECLPGGSMAPN